MRGELLNDFIERFKGEAFSKMHGDDLSPNEYEMFDNIAGSDGEAYEVFEIATSLNVQKGREICPASFSTIKDAIREYGLEVDELDDADPEDSECYFEDGERNFNQCERCWEATLGKVIDFLENYDPDDKEREEE